jgi:hypothetical protein
VKLRWLERAGPPLARTAITLLAGTWRFRVRGDDALRAVRASGRPVVLLVWHSRMLPLLYLHRHEGVVLLVSRHRDGTYLADLATKWGYRAVRGSSRRGGDIGLLGIVRALRQGQVVGLTPDGPQGPAEQMKVGALVAARHAGAAVVPIGARPSAAWWLRSWDRFCVPRPFATIDVVYGTPQEVGPGEAGLESAAIAIQRALQTATYPS